MKRTFFIIAIVLAALCVVLGVYYSIPGVPHPFFVAGYGKIIFVNPLTQPIAARYTHHKYTAAFLVLALLLGGVAFFSRGRKSVVNVA
ncbi:MAG TPA: hypothetical protein VGT44_20490 [Ktedonobacteraceae bacterium]|nr:hypothetical protein [Chthonomonadales bacterium]HEV2583251.1 hypothetical protein [Ktedonobacteraceae bacterium]